MTVKVSIGHDDYGFIKSIDVAGWTILQLVPGTVRNKTCAAAVAAALRKLPRNELMQLVRLARNEPDGAGEALPSLVKNKPGTRRGKGNRNLQN